MDENTEDQGTKVVICYFMFVFDILFIQRIFVEQVFY